LVMIGSLTANASSSPSSSIMIKIVVHRLHGYQFFIYCCCLNGCAIGVECHNL
jgi:hypothetical protein